MLLHTQALPTNPPPLHDTASSEHSHNPQRSGTALLPRRMRLASSHSTDEHISPSQQLQLLLLPHIITDARTLSTNEASVIETLLLNQLLWGALASTRILAADRTRCFSLFELLPNSKVDDVAAQERVDWAMGTRAG